MDGRPLFDAGRYLTLQTATTPLGSRPDPIAWHAVFTSRIDDSDPAAGGDSDVMTIGARDTTCDVLDTWIEDTLGTLADPFGDANVDLVLFAFLEAGFGPVQPIRLVTDPIPGPSIFVKGTTYDPASTLLYMRMLALLTGARWRVNGGRPVLPYLGRRRSARDSGIVL